MDDTENILKRHTDQLYRLEKNDRKQDDKLAKIEKEAALQEKDISELKDDLVTIRDNTTWIKRAIIKGGISLAVIIIGGVFVYLLTNM